MFLAGRFVSAFLLTQKNVTGFDIYVSECKKKVDTAV